ncbi:MAG: translation initiation factor IF-6 [Candidatus Micrarchaeota archaeon]|nr:translation initiation factor IF-6 [Candidatus Micrarchaeota archaeon]
MGIARLAIEGNSYIGAFGIATDKFAIVGSNAAHKKIELMAETLGVKVIGGNIDNSHLMGIYVSANSNGVLLPFTSYHTEVEHIKRELKEFSVDVFKSDMNALRNNILANDRIAIINPYYSQKDEKEIADVLGVETIRRSIAGFSTVGANNILTNKGVVLNNRVTEEEKKELEGILKMEAEQSTGNTGSLNIGLCTIANSNGILVGAQSTGFEMARMAQALGF